jgi:hypothetical protein
MIFVFGSYYPNISMYNYSHCITIVIVAPCYWRGHHDRSAVAVRQDLLALRSDAYMLTEVTG